MKGKTTSILLVFALCLSPLLSAQEKDLGWKTFEYLLIERRDQRNEILSHSLRPKVSLEKSRTLGIGKIDFHLKSLDYKSNSAHVWLDGEEFDAEVIIIQSNLLPRETSAPVKVKPGEKPNEFVEKKSEEEVKKAIRSRFEKMEEKLSERKKEEDKSETPSK